MRILDRPEFIDKKNLTLKDLEKLDEILDEDEDEESVLLRKLAQRQYDFSGFDHINMYDVENYRMGVLQALERTRRRLSIDSMHSIIDYYYTLGYSKKRILFALFQFGFENFYNRQVDTYIHKNRHRLNTARQNLMNELEMVSKGVYQQMQSQVMESEKRTLEQIMRNIRQLQDELETVNPSTEFKKLERIHSMIEKLEKRAKEMNGIDALRRITEETAKAEEVGKVARSLGEGYHDARLKELAEKRHAENPVPGTSRDVSGKDVVVLE